MSETITTQAVREMAERLREHADARGGPSLENDFWQRAVNASNMLIALVEERDSLYARLEMVEAYDGEGNRISVEPYSIPDGIEARDATIRLLDDRVKALTARVEAAEAERDRLAEANAKKADDIVTLGQLVGKAEARAEAAEAALRETRAALEPFTTPPLYVLDGEDRFVPEKMPDEWIGGGWFSSDDFRRAITAYHRTSHVAPASPNDSKANQ